MVEPMTYDRAAIMRDAHKRFRDGKRLALDWTFSRCLSTAWAAAKARESFPEAAAGRSAIVCATDLASAPERRLTSPRRVGLGERDVVCGHIQNGSARALSISPSASISLPRAL